MMVASLLTACAAPRHDVVVKDTPTTARPQPIAPAATPSGGIFQPAAYRPLFEDRKPRYVGDILTVQINERLKPARAPIRTPSAAASSRSRCRA